LGLAVGGLTMVLLVGLCQGTAQAQVTFPHNHGDGVTPHVCPLSQGFWKNHLDDWQCVPTLGGIRYTKDELLAILKAPPRGDHRYILAKQLIAARLNICAGTDSSPIDTALASADALLAEQPKLVATSKFKDTRMTNLGDQLDSYNQGFLTADCLGHADGHHAAMHDADDDHHAGVPIDGECEGQIVHGDGVHPRVCPLSQGFWKTHPKVWRCSPLPTLGGIVYSKAELVAILKSPVVGDARFILAKQLIAAKLNICGGSDPNPISAAIASADALLAGQPKLVTPSQFADSTMTDLGGQLDNYNQGFLTPDCDGTSDGHDADHHAHDATHH
jgi:hypothetical protein